MGKRGHSAFSPAWKRPEPGMLLGREVGCRPFLLCAVTAFGLLITGCERSDSSSAAQAPAADPAVLLDTPENATRSLFHFLRAQLRALAEDDKAAARHRDQVVWHIAARDEIVARYRKVRGGRVKDEIAVLRRCVENWAAVIAYYADGLGLDQMRLDEGAKHGLRAVVLVPARGRDDQAVIRVTCLLGEEDKWRVRAINFAEPATAGLPPAPTQPIPTPATGPAGRER